MSVISLLHLQIRTLPIHLLFIWKSGKGYGTHGGCCLCSALPSSHTISSWHRCLSIATISGGTPWLYVYLPQFSSAARYMCADNSQNLQKMKWRNARLLHEVPRDCRCRCLLSLPREWTIRADLPNLPREWTIRADLPNPRNIHMSRLMSSVDRIPYLSSS